MQDGCSAGGIATGDDQTAPCANYNDLEFANGTQVIEGTQSDATIAIRWIAETDRTINEFTKKKKKHNQILCFFFY